MIAGSSAHRIAQILKRVLDVSTATALLVLLSPVLLAIAVAIALVDGRPFLFRQIRPGIDGKLFEIIKFRTMRVHNKGEDLWTSDAARVTPLGRFLRRTSLDELPELWNVVCGDMSLVGPRPLLHEYLPRYSARQALRHTVRPGITGLAQVSGRRALTLGERLDLDVWYVENWTLALDLRILFRSLLVPFAKGDNPEQPLTDIDDVGFLIASSTTAASQDCLWESGSFFPAYRGPIAEDSYITQPNLLLATGRQAIAAAFFQGQQHYGWQRLLLPEYFCPQVTSWLAEECPVDTYACSPQHFTWPRRLEKGDAVLALAYFGHPPPLERGPPGEQLILDVTHDPFAAWIPSSGASYAIASLRKTLPVPDGGLLWSPSKLPLELGNSLGPPLAIADDLMQAMENKADYLEGRGFSKSSWRTSFSQAESELMTASALSLGSPTTRNLLEHLPISLFRERRSSNIQAVTRLVPQDPRVCVWPSSFGLILLFSDSATRDQMRKELEQRNVYAAILWSIKDERRKDRRLDFGLRMLHIHTDYRYSSSDMHRIGRAIHESLSSLRESENV